MRRAPRLAPRTRTRAGRVILHPRTTFTVSSRWALVWTPSSLKLTLKTIEPPSTPNRRSVRPRRGRVATARRCASEVMPLFVVCVSEREASTACTNIVCLQWLYLTMSSGGKGSGPRASSHSCRVVEETTAALSPKRSGASVISHNSAELLSSSRDARPVSHPGARATRCTRGVCCAPRKGCN